ncbi:recombination protein NinB [Citrobacter sp. Ce104]|uniref:recombination protein NinB n=1 Tax=Citrobacter sp. Ce104 TaxID=2985040 RepID=UPI0025753919|nr:recombination protein NinB [Citrobacter sp. Ce104]MDM3281798.1 recombination protein NinB [Citrobacter sp. Ce104]
MKQQFLLRNTNIRANAINAINQLQIDEKRPVVIEIKEMTRSIDQNSKLWAILGDVSSQVEWHGRKLSSESWKHIFTAALIKQEVVPNLTGDGFVVLGQSTSKMTVGQMRDLIELIHAFGAERNVRWGDESRLAMEWASRFGGSHA